MSPQIEEFLQSFPVGDTGFPQIEDDYAFGRFLGAGGFGLVFQGWDLKRKIPVAIKFILHGNEATHAEWIARLVRFYREGELLSRLDHQNIVGFLDASCFRRQHYLVMEYVHGGSLASVLSERGSLTPGETLFVLRRTCKGVAELHRKKTVHRDIKPGNILISCEGDIKVADLGIGRNLEHDPTLTQGFIGTPRYTPPDLRENLDTHDWRPSDDVYSLTLTLVRSATGTEEIPLERRQDTPTRPNLAQLSSSLSASLIQIAERGLDLSRPGRFQNADELLEALDELDLEESRVCAPRPRDEVWSPESGIKFFRDETTDRLDPPEGSTRTRVPARIRSRHLSLRVYVVGGILVLVVLFLVAFFGRESWWPSNRQSNEDANNSELREVKPSVQLEPKADSAALSSEQQSSARDSLERAIQNGDEARVKALLSGGVDLANPLPCKRSALVFAIKCKKPEILRLLVAPFKSRLEEPTGEEARTALCMAIMTQDAKLVSILVEAGAKLDTTDRYGRTPLHLASQIGAVKVIEVLHPDRAALSQENAIDGKTALYYGVEGLRKEVVQLLLKLGASPDQVTGTGISPRALAKSKGLESLFEN